MAIIDPQTRFIQFDSVHWAEADTAPAMTTTAAVSGDHQFLALKGASLTAERNIRQETPLKKISERSMMTRVVEAGFRHRQPVTYVKPGMRISVSS